MSIRILDHNGNAQPLSARMSADFQSQLRRIGESPSPLALNLWVSNQTPAELLETLRSIPDRPADDRCRRDGAQTPTSQDPAVGDGNEGAAAAVVSTNNQDGAMARYQVDEPASDVQETALHHRAIPSAEKAPFWKHGPVYNSAYQRETGHIYVDPCGLGERVNRNGRNVNLRDEEERERDRREGSVGGNGGD